LAVRFGRGHLLRRHKRSKLSHDGDSDLSSDDSEDDGPVEGTEEFNDLKAEVMGDRSMWTRTG
jgi:hypothetical protein